MAEITLDQAPRKTRELFEKAASAMERGNLDYAMDMFSNMLEVEPRLMQARKMLRAAQLKKLRETGGGGAMKHIMSTLSGIGGLMSAKMALKSKPLQALSAAEKLMRTDPHNPAFFNLLVNAAMAADMPEVAVHTLEMAREAAPKDTAILARMADLYRATGDTTKGLECCEQIVALRPNDPLAVKALKDAQANNSMKQGRWTDGTTDFRSKLKNEDEAKSLEQEARAVKTSSDLETLIKEQTLKIQREPQNLNYRRALADLYGRNGQYDEALEALNAANEITGGGDPQIDRAITNLSLRKFDVQIEAARAEGAQDQVATLEAEKNAFVLADAEDRVRRYPNDLQFKFELGVLFFEHDRFQEAIQQLQLSQRNPQRRLRSLYYLARCFVAKGQFDIAAEQLEKAASEMMTMDDTKKDVIFELGIVYDHMGQRDKAVDCFKQIYSVDISFRDVAQRIDKSYKP